MIVLIDIQPIELVVLQIRQIHTNIYIYVCIYIYILTSKYIYLITFSDLEMHFSEFSDFYAKNENWVPKSLILRQ